MRTATTSWLTRIVLWARSRDFAPPASRLPFSARVCIDRTIRPVAAVAQMALDSAVETANEKHMTPWMQLRRDHGVENTPLSPFLHIELIRNNHLSLGA